MIQKTKLLVLALLAGSVAAPVCGEEPFVKPGKVDNAALVYWQAFAFLPDLSQDEMELLKQVESGQATVASVEPILAKSSESLKLVQNVGPSTACRWGTIQNGPETLLPHLSKARLLARLLIAQAITDVNNKRFSTAVERLLQAFLIARNVDEGALVQMLVGDSIDTLVVKSATPLIGKLDKASLNRLHTSLQHLAPRITLAKSMEYERDLFALWMKDVVLADKNRARISLKPLGLQAKDVDALLAGNLQERTALYEEFLGEYNRVIAAASRPVAEAQQKLSQLEASYQKSSNPFILLLMSSVDRAGQSHSKASQRFSTFAKAVRELAETQ